MYSKQTTIRNSTGLHARPASEFVKKAKEFKSSVYVKNLATPGDPANAKSIIMLLSEGMTKGTNIEISAEGTDESEAVDALIALIETGFGEA